MANQKRLASRVNASLTSNRVADLDVRALLDTDLDDDTALRAVQSATLSPLANECSRLTIGEPTLPGSEVAFSRDTFSIAAERSSI